MTEQDYIDLSKRVAEKLGISTCEMYDCGFRSRADDGMRELWLHQDSARCFELMCEHQLCIYCYIDGVMAQDKNGGQYFQHDLRHNNDRNLAARVAILKALEAM